MLARFGGPASQPTYLLNLGGYGPNPSPIIVFDS